MSKDIYVTGQDFHGEVYVKFLKKHAQFFLGMAAGLMFLGMLGIIDVYLPVIKSEIKYQVERSEYKARLEDLNKEADTIAEVQNSAAEWNVNSQFSVVIPKIGASKNIIANVDVANEAIYKSALKKGVAHAKSTYFPGQGNNIFLFAHSTNNQFNVEKYNATFYLLHKLKENDPIYVYFSDKKYVYNVDSVNIVDPSDVSWLENTDEERLTLQTCYPPGTTLKRLIVTAKPA